MPRPEGSSSTGKRDGINRVSHALSRLASLALVLPGAGGYNSQISWLKLHRFGLDSVGKLLEGISLGHSRRSVSSRYRAQWEAAGKPMVTLVARSDESQERRGDAEVTAKGLASPGKLQCEDIPGTNARLSS